jgi:hypothetical protein
MKEKGISRSNYQFGRSLSYHAVMLEFGKFRSRSGALSFDASPSLQPTTALPHDNELLRLQQTTSTQQSHEDRKDGESMGAG